MEEMEQKAKRPQDSMTEMVQMVMPANLNSDNSLFGGAIMEWIDIMAGVVSRRHCGRATRTAAVERLEFLAPAYLKDIVTLKGRVTFVGNTSMEVCVDSFVERFGMENENIHVNRALLTMVAVDDNGKPAKVPQLIISTDEEKEMWEAAQIRRTLRKQLTGK